MARAPAHFLLLFAAGLLAGTMNAAAGGGSFVTLPTLERVGWSLVRHRPANATSTVALFPGTLAAAYGYRHDAKPLGVTDIRAMSAVRMVLVGAANSVAVVIFIIARLVWWPQMLVGDS